MMNALCRAGAIIVFLGGVFLPLASRGQSLDLIGVNVLRSVVTNLNGAGIPVAQPEADVTLSPLGFEINPPYAYSLGRPITYASADGVSTNFPNSLGGDSWHADTVANYFFGWTSGIATNVAHVDNFDANYYVTNYVLNWPQPPLGDAVVNESFFYGYEVTNLPTPANELGIIDQQQIDQAYDDFSTTYGTLFVSSVGDGGSPPYQVVVPPGTAYNSIGAGSYGIGTQSGIGPTLDNGRCKPDLVAPAGVTSYSTPMIAGAAALLLEGGGRGDGGANTNAATDNRTVKALLLNGAVKPPGWTNGPNAPLDTRYGAGLLNVFNSYEELAGGQQTNCTAALVAAGGVHPPGTATNPVAALSGWDFNTVTSGATNDALNHYYFNVTNGNPAGRFTATATLVWERQWEETNINRLALFLYAAATSNLVACSTSLVDNVQHFRVPELAAGMYDLQIWKAGGTNTVSTNEAYAVAFAFTADPALSAIRSGTNVTLMWPAYPAGYGLQTATGLVAAVWSTNGMPNSQPLVTVTNGMNQAVLPATNRTRFFRLSSPNF